MSNKGRSIFSFCTGSSRKRSLKQTPSKLSFSWGKQKPNSSKSMVFQPTLEEMKWAFDKFDSNKDRKISCEEYKSAQRAIDSNKEISETEAAKSFGIVDTDGDGFVDFKEFVELYSMNGGEVKADIESAFKVYDSNGDGKISAEEVREIMKMLGERSNLTACRQMVKGVDGDGDGFIDIKEFTKMMSSNSIKFQN